MALFKLVSSSPLPLARLELLSAGYYPVSCLILYHVYAVPSELQSSVNKMTCKSSAVSQERAVGCVPVSDP